MTLDELVRSLTELRDAAGSDLPVRLWITRGTAIEAEVLGHPIVADHYDILDVEEIEATEGPMIFIHSGSHAATVS